MAKSTQKPLNNTGVAEMAFTANTVPVLPAVSWSEAAEAFRKWRGIDQKGHFCI